MDVFSEIVTKIIARQENIIGPVALEQARKVEGLNIDWPKGTIEFKGDKTEIIDDLVEQYQNLFGRTSVEVCREAVAGLISKIQPPQIPHLLQ